MKQKVAQEMARSFAAVLSIKSIRTFVDSNRTEYEKWLELEKQSQEQKQSTPKKHRVSRKGVK